jgi:hypothetical protein
MKNGRQILWACVIPLILAVVCLFISNFVWKIGMNECKDKISFGDLSCASNNTQFIYDCSVYSIYGLVLLSIMSPCILELRARPAKQTKIFD